MFDRVTLEKCCTVTVIKEVQKGLSDQTAAKHDHNVYSFEVLAIVKRHSQVNQITRHKTVACATMTELKTKV